MENWRKNSRKDIVMVDVDALVPKDHLLRKIENVMDYEWLYARLSPYYCADNGRPGADPVVLIKMVLLQHLYGIPSLRQTYREIQVNIAYRWFLGYSLLDEIPHFATVSYAFCKRFPPEVSEEIFAHILNKALNHRMVDPSMIFIDGTHIKASANKKKFQKEQAAKTAKVYEEQLHKEVAEERRKLGKKDKDDDNSGSSTGGCTVEKTVSKTDPDCGMFVKGTHERQFAYEAHTACDKHGIVLGVEITAGNVSDSVAWDAVYDQVTEKFSEVKFVMMDAGYKTPWIAKKVLEDSRIPILPYTRYKGKKISLSLGILLTLQQQTVLPVPEDMNCGIRPQAKKGNGLTAAHPKSAKTVPAELFVAQMKADSGYSQLISGRNISIWSNI